MRTSSGAALGAFFLIVIGFCLAAFADQGASIQPVDLRCEYLVDPCGIDVAAPRLSWTAKPALPGLRELRQSAYRVLAATSAAQLEKDRGDLWDTGKVASDQSIQLVYAGKPLASGTAVFWKVQVWDQDGRMSPWSRPAKWSMGLLRPGDWKGRWIGRDETRLWKNPASPYWNLGKARWIWHPEDVDAATKAPEGACFFRTNVTLVPGQMLRKAVAVVGADDRFELWVNKERIGMGTSVQMPQDFDLAPYLKSGDNEVLIEARNTGKAQPAGLIAAVRLDYGKIEPVLFLSGRQWQAARQKDGPWAEAGELGPYGMKPWGEVGFAEERVLPARMLRKEFTTPKPVRRATAYVCGVGLFELFINGSKIGDQVLSPGLTDYDKRTMYMTFDVTEKVVAGRNAVGVVLGNGRFWAPRAAVPVAMRSFGYPKLLAQIELEYADGSREVVASDDSWRLTTEGPIRSNNEFDGEEYDARREMRNWSTPGFDDAGWESAAPVSGPSGGLVAQMAEPLRVVENLKPVKITEPREGVFVFDMGQNMVGWCRLTAAGPKGSVIRLRHAETLQPNGMLYVDNLRSARATDTYILRGEGQEVWEPSFTYHGFRYVEVTGFPGTPTLRSLQGRVVHDDMRRTADFACSNPLLDQIHRNIYWGVRGNYRSIPTDCPQRDERQGWLGDRSVVSRSESYLFDVAAFYTKWVTDISDSQKPAGSVPVVAPAYWVFYHDDVTWPSTFVIVPGMLYDQYGDLRVIQRNYPALKRWIDYMLKSYLKDGLMPRDTYADWCVPPEKPELIHSQDPTRKTNGTLIGTAYFYQMLRLMTRYASLIGERGDQRRYEEQANQMKAAFHKRFLNPLTGLYDNGTQTSSILPLAFGMSPLEHRSVLFEGLVRKVSESDFHVGTGLVGAQWLMRTLSEGGRPDLAYRIANQRSYPGWGYMIEQGATTIWELWNGNTADPAMNSGNHVMQIGDLNVWLYEYLAGIRPDPDKPGFKHIHIRPHLIEGLSHVRASHESMYGRIATAWTRQGNEFELIVDVPANTTADVFMPGKDASTVTESGQPAGQAKGVKFVRLEGDRAVFAVGSGRYVFRNRVEGGR